MSQWEDGRTQLCEAEVQCCGLVAFVCSRKSHETLSGLSPAFASGSLRVPLQIMGWAGAVPSRAKEDRVREHMKFFV